LEEDSDSDVVVVVVVGSDVEIVTIEILPKFRTSRSVIFQQSNARQFGVDCFALICFALLRFVFH
jgi:uncharacterized membrane protein YjgN (DUF898 family)